MKHFLIATACVATLSGCMSDTPTATKPAAVSTSTFVRVDNATAFSETVANRRLEALDNPSVWFRLNSDGTMDGELKRGTVNGTWTFENGYWCREFEAGGRASPRDCQTAELLGNQIRLTRDKGAGDAGIYKIQ